MELLDKYLQAVKFWLPSAQQADIIAELRDDIRSQVEERESELGRRLSENEWEELLKQRGRPLLVAEKYLPQRSLIGPVLFPAYWFVLRLTFLCYLVPWVAVWMGFVVFNPGYRAHHLGIAVLQDVSALWMNVWIVFTVVTAVFAALERAKDKSWLTHDWSPRKLPPVRDTQRIPRANSGFELTFGAIFGIWWLNCLWSLNVIKVDSVSISLTPGWHRLFWPFLGLLLINSALSATNFMRPYWTRSRRAAKAAANFGAAALLAVALKIQPTILVSLPSVKTEQILEGALDITIIISVVIAILVSIIIACVELWRIYSEIRKRTYSPQRASV